MLDGECVRDCSGYPGEAIVLRFCAGVIAESPTPCVAWGHAQITINKKTSVFYSWCLMRNNDISVELWIFMALLFIVI